MVHGYRSIVHEYLAVDDIPRKAVPLLAFVDLLHLEPQQAWFGTAGRRCLVTVAGIKRLAASV